MEKIVGIGTDIVDIRRMRRARFLDRVADFVLNQEEQSQFEKSPDRAEFLASRLAAKESLIKAYPSKLTYKDISIIKKGKKPEVVFVRQEDKNYMGFVSIAHEYNYAVGYAMIGLQNGR